jgi:hypothetical protein
VTFAETLRQQRWDDHRYYHHNRINQSLHLLSAASFLVAYGYLLVEPTVAVMIAWLVSMPTRQAGHFFFEPHTYDDVNQTSHEHKESIKVGYNLARKVVLLTIWLVSPALLRIDPSGFGWLTPHVDAWTLAHNVSVLWLIVGVGGVLFRMLQLFLLADVRTGLAWVTKIVTDPVHDIMLYRRAPLQVLRGELYAPAAGQHLVSPH